jgi:broad specificity phosphatase PhoE
MRGFVLRHALSEYKQGKVSLAEANDIVPGAEEPIINSTREIVRMYDPRRLKIKSSPYGRCLASSKQVAKVLTSLDKLTGEIEIEPNLEEVKGLNYPVLKAVAEGGSVLIDGKPYDIDAKDTNPASLPITLFFRRDLIHTPEVQRKLNKEVARVVSQFETAVQVRKRLYEVLAGLNTDTILVSHEGLGAIDYGRVNSDPNKFQDRGKFITFDKRRGQWKPTYTNSW